MRLAINPNRSDWSSVIARPAVSSRDMVAIVAPIFEAVRARGDQAVREFTQKYDGVSVDDLRVARSDISASAVSVTAELKEAVGVAARNIERFHAEQVEEDISVETMAGVRCWRKARPIRRVGLYVPGGSAPLLSTVLMLGIPARIAGCEEIVLCTPPGAEGSIDPALLYATQVAGIEDVFRVGGAQAVAAMTYGTDTIPRVDKIFGPGNQYVTAAKQYASLEGVAIDMPAGPTEVAIVADGSCPASFIAFDILAQAEHGPDSHVLLIVFDEVFAREVIEAADVRIDAIPRAAIARRALENSVCVVVGSQSEAMDLCNAYAPEHLILATENARDMADHVRAAGSVFVGVMSPESAGDYASGTNHTLPTGGAARAYSGVSVESFMTRITFQEISDEGIRALGPTIIELARAEGLEAHGRAVSERLDSLQT